VERKKNFRRASELNANTNHSPLYGEFSVAEETNTKHNGAGWHNSLILLFLRSSTVAGLTLLTAGKYDRPSSNGNRTLSWNRPFPEAHLWLSRAYWGKGLYRKAITEDKKQRLILAARRDTYRVGCVLAVAGKESEAHISSTSSLDRQRAGYVSPFYFAGI